MTLLKWNGDSTQSKVKHLFSKPLSGEGLVFSSFKQERDQEYHQQGSKIQNNTGRVYFHIIPDHIQVFINISELNIDIFCQQEKEYQAM